MKQKKISTLSKHPQKLIAPVGMSRRDVRRQPLRYRHPTPIPHPPRAGGEVRSGATKAFPPWGRGSQDVPKRRLADHGRPCIISASGGGRWGGSQGRENGSWQDFICRAFGPTSPHRGGPNESVTGPHKCKPPQSPTTANSTSMVEIGTRSQFIVGSLKR